MKKILGLDLGTASIGWALVSEAENEKERSKIEKLGVRIIHYGDNLKVVDRKSNKLTEPRDPVSDFAGGKGLSSNAGRTQKRGARRNLKRYQIRRAELIRILKENNFLQDNSLLSENGSGTTFHTLAIRAKATKQQITKEEFAKVLLMLNKKRGYKSSRKAKQDDDGTSVNGMEVAIHLYENELTPGQYTYTLLKSNEKDIPDYYRSDLQSEFDRIWIFQSKFYPNLLTEELYKNVFGKSKGQTWSILSKALKLEGIKQSGKPAEIKLERYLWRNLAVEKEMELEKLSVVFQEINSQINSSSGYLGAISDRSKELYFKKITVGEYLFNQIKQNPHTRLKNQVFYRQDYLDEFNIIWEKQKEFYPELTEQLKSLIRDVVIFYQRRLRSQKHLISECRFENHHKVIPKSSPLFQEFKIWSILNNLELRNIETGERFSLELENKELLFNELNIKPKLSSEDILKLLVNNYKQYELNYKELEGNRTNAALYDAYFKMFFSEDELSYMQKKSASDINEIISSRFLELGIDTGILFLDYTLEKDDFDKQPLLQLWHLLYSFEGDNSRTGDEKLIQKLTSKFGFSIENAQIMAKINFINDYGSLSSKAIRKIMPYLSQGQRYDEACYLAKYNHSYSLTKEELSNRTLQGRLELLSKNSLRNPMVEKILNQMVHVVNGIIDDKTLGRPDEIRLELARELKYSADERRKMTEGIAKATKEHEEYRKVLENEFGISKVTRNDLIRYKLWLELEPNGYKTLYTNTYIPKEKLFSKEFDIEHIIPKARLFDDSFSNKTLAKREINLAKKDETAYDFLSNYLNKEEFEQYLSRINLLYKNKQISKAKYNKLKMKGDELPEDFIERDLRNTQYIAKKANEMLEQVVRTVNTTTGSITDRLRQDWDLVNIMQEINLHKYEKLGLVKLVQGKDGRIEKQIQDWSKRNDHRHHAVDALAVAFTTHSHVQYLNNLNARKDSSNKKHASIIGIEQKYLYRNEKGKLLFKPPMPINVFREEAKRQIENILISFKASNKVVTRNMNKIKIKGKDNYKTQITLTPRGQLHKESFYGSIKRYETKDEKINASFTVDKIKQVAKLSYRIALLNRLTEFGNDPKLAFSGKNALAKNPIYLDKAKTLLVPEKVKLVWMEPSFTIRKEITPELKIDKVLDKKVKHILEERLKEYNGNAKAAFSNINENPIWLNKEKGIAIKRVKITGVSNAIALHDKRNHLGEVMLDESGNPISTDFVSTGNNHHVAVYQDSDGNLFEEVVSFFEAVIRANNHLPIIDKNKENLDFLFSMKQNEYFVFPSKEFNPEEIDLLSQDNYALISKHLFRVQKLSTKNYLFVHHLETKSVDGETLKTKKELSGITFHFIHTPSKLSGIVKVQINHLGKIFHVGEI